MKGNPECTAISLAANNEINMSEYEEGLRQLRKYEYKLKVQDMDETKRAVEDIVDNIVDGISAQDEQFALKEEKRGSVYEKLKIDEPDEFDFDLPLVELARDTLQQQWYSLPGKIITSFVILISSTTFVFGAKTI